MDRIDGAKSKEHLIRGVEVQVFHVFASQVAAKANLTTDLFQQDVVGETKDLLEAAPEVWMYQSV